MKIYHKGIKIRSMLQLNAAEKRKTAKLEIIIKYKL